MSAAKKPIPTVLSGHDMRALRMGSVANVSIVGGYQPIDDGRRCGMPPADLAPALTIDQAVTQLATTYTSRDRLLACEALVAAAEREAARLRAVLAEPQPDRCQRCGNWGGEHDRDCIKAKRGEA